MNTKKDRDLVLLSTCISMVGMTAILLIQNILVLTPLAQSIDKKSMEIRSIDRAYQLVIDNKAEENSFLTSEINRLKTELKSLEVQD